MAQFPRVIATALVVAAFMALCVSGEITLHSCDGSQCVFNAVTGSNSSHQLFFYDSLDPNSMRVYNTLTTLKTQRNHIIDVLDIRNTHTEWLLSSFEVFYVPTFRHVRWTPSGRKILDGYQGMDFSPMSLAQYLDRH